MGGIYSCSPKKDAFINRNYQAVVTEYNVLFNGYNSLNEGVEALDNEYQDNYWEILPIERLQLSEAIILPGQESNAYFQKAEEKAVKAIQKHSMMFRNREKTLKSMRPIYYWEWQGIMTRGSFRLRRPLITSCINILIVIKLTKLEYGAKR